MAKTFKGIAGGMFDQRVHLRDSRHAADNFGLNKAYLGHGTPRHKFQFFVAFKFNQEEFAKEHVENFLGQQDQFLVTTLVKTVELPSVSIDTETLNQYNRKKISQTKINFDPVSITFHDTVDGKTLRLWEMYYEYYFRDGVAPEKLEDSRTRDKRQYREIRETEFLDNAGYNIQRVFNQPYLIDSLSIYQVHGGKFSRTELVHPRISAFKHDTLDYAATSDLVEMSMTLDYEAVLYANVNERLNDEELSRYANGDFWEMANLITIRSEEPGRNIEVQARFPKAPQLSPEAGEQTDDTAFGRLSSRVVQRVGGTLGGIVDSIPDAIGSAVSTSIFGGTISFDPDPVKAVKTTANQIGRDIIGTSRREITTGIAGAVRTAGTNVAGAIFQTGETEDEGGEVQAGTGDVSEDDG